MMGNYYRPHPNIQEILKEIEEVSFRDEETGDELVYVGDVEFILTTRNKQIPTPPKEGECVHIGRHFPDSSKEDR